MAWQPRSDAQRRRHSETAFILTMFGLLAIGYGPLLRQVHELSELLIR